MNTQFEMYLIFVMLFCFMGAAFCFISLVYMIFYNIGGAQGLPTYPDKPLKKDLKGVQK